MANFFADRGTVLLNSKELAFCKSVKVTIDESISQVDHMSSDYIGSGYKRGNKKVTGSFELDIPITAAQIDLAIKNGQQVALAFIFGGEKYTVKDMVQSSQDLTGSVGEAGKTINFMALNCINENGQITNSTYGL